MSGRNEKKRLIIPVFIPSLGCPYKCVFCDQEKITSQSEAPVSAVHIRQVIDTSLAISGFKEIPEREIAFYGGTFTRLEPERMIELLKIAAGYINDGLFHSVRISTRPDEIDKRRLDILKMYNVSTVELGIQSMDNEVLKLSGRGHCAEDTVRAMELLGEYGFKRGAQLMPGLPGDSKEKFMETIHKVLELKPDMARLYPAVIIKGTALEKFYREGRYIPLTLEEAVKICGESCILLEKNNIRVIRIGLMTSPFLLQEGEVVAGPWHNSFGFLVRSYIYLQNVIHLLPKPGETERIGIRIFPNDIPLLRGFKNQGIHKIREQCGALVEYVRPDDSLPSGSIAVDRI